MRERERGTYDEELSRRLLLLEEWDEVDLTLFDSSSSSVWVLCCCSVHVFSVVSGDQVGSASGVSDEVGSGSGAAPDPQSQEMERTPRDVSAKDVNRPSVKSRSP